MIGELLEHVRRLQATIAKLEGLAVNVQDLLRHLVTPKAPPRPPDHFAMMLVLAETLPAARVVVGGAAGVLNGAGERTLHLAIQVSRPLHGLQVLVFCDLSKVAVNGLFVGIDLLPMNLASGVPLSWATHATPGQQIGATLRLRDVSGLRGAT